MELHPINCNCHECILDGWVDANTKLRKQIEQLQAYNETLKDRQRNAEIGLAEVSASHEQLQAEVKRLQNEIFRYNEELSDSLTKLATLTENTVANLLCYLIDNHENEQMCENKFQEIGRLFLKSEYNKP